MQPRPVPADLVGLCFNCMGNDHVKANCTFPSRCRSCHREGHRARDSPYPHPPCGEGQQAGALTSWSLESSWDRPSAGLSDAVEDSTRRHCLCAFGFHRKVTFRSPLLRTAQPESHRPTGTDGGTAGAGSHFQCWRGEPWNDEWRPRCRRRRGNTGAGTCGAGCR